ncbi:MAG: DNA-binding domain-containing protein [Gemmiger sp.]
MDAPAKHSGKKQGPAARPLESYSGEERAEISYWLTLVDRWQQYRRKAGGRKAECDEAFVRLTYLEDPLKRQISVETLYRKWAAIRAGDLDALVDKRGKARKGKTVLLPEIEQEFLSLYLDEAQLPIPRCVALTEQWARDNMPTALPLPSYHTFYRKAKAVPYAVAVLCREGEKAYYDKCSPYIRREYESIAANDFWIGDTHTLDVESMGPDGTLHRLYLSAWLDARSGIFTVWYVTASPGSQATLNALRKGIATRGIPLNVYVDNGREYLTRDIGGLGHRKKGKDSFAPPGVFERLGIKMTNAIKVPDFILLKKFAVGKRHTERLSPPAPKRWFLYAFLRPCVILP